MARHTRKKRPARPKGAPAPAGESQLQPFSHRGLTITFRQKPGGTVVGSVEDLATPAIEGKSRSEALPRGIRAAVVARAEALVPLERGRYLGFRYRLKPSPEPAAEEEA